MKRTKTMRRIIATTLTTCLFCSALAEAKKPDNSGGGGGDEGPSYQIVKLDTDNGAGGVLEGTAVDINDSRLIVGGVYDSSGPETTTTAVYWTVTDDNGTPESMLHFLDDFFHTQSFAHGCNELGEIVGSSDDLFPVYWANKNSIAEVLPAPLARSEALAISNNGVICGGSMNGFSPTLEQRALVWSFSGGEWNYLELAPLGDPGQDEDGNVLPNQAVAVAVSDEDAVSGVITIAGRSNGNAVIWTVVLDEFGELSAGPAMILAPAAEATGINNVGTVCGFGLLGPSSGGDGVVWINGGQAELLALDTSRIWNSPRSAFAFDVNDDGVLVGYSFVRAVVWPSKDSPLIVLNDFLPRRKSPFSSLSIAHAVSESGEIVGRGGTEDLDLPFLAIPK